MRSTERQIRTIQSIDRVAAILKALASGPRRLGVTELSLRLDITPSTIHGILRTLQLHGFVEQDMDSGKYQLGSGLLRLGSSYLDLNELRKRSFLYASALATKTGKPVRVGVRAGACVLVVHHALRPDAGLQILEVGAELPLHASALGKAVLAFLPGNELSAFMAEDGSFPKLTKRTLTGAKLVQELASIRSTNVAREQDEAVLGESGLAAPIFDHRGLVIGAIGVVAETANLKARRMGRLEKVLVIDAARNISRELGTRAWPPSEAAANE